MKVGDPGSFRIDAWRQLLLGAWTLTEVARRSAVPLSTVSDILNGCVNPGFDHAMAIAKALGVPAEVLHHALTEMRQERLAIRKRLEAIRWQGRRDAINRLIEGSGGRTGKSSGISNSEQAFGRLVDLLWPKTRLVDKVGGSRAAAAPEPPNARWVPRSPTDDRRPRRP